MTVFFAKWDRQIVKCNYMYPLDYALQYLIPSNLYYKLDFLFPKRPKEVDKLKIFNISPYE